MPAAAQDCDTSRRDFRLGRSRWSNISRLTSKGRLIPGIEQVVSAEQFNLAYLIVKNFSAFEIK